jgi:hypothetical protein
LLDDDESPSYEDLTNPVEVLRGKIAFVRKQYGKMNRGGVENEKIWNEMSSDLAETMSIVGERIESFDDPAFDGSVYRLGSNMRAFGKALEMDVGKYGVQQLTMASATAAARTPPFYMAVVGKTVLEALDFLEEATTTLMLMLESLWSRANKRRAGLALLSVLGEVRKAAVEVRGRLTGTWPTLTLEKGQAIEGRPHRNAPDKVEKGTVTQVGGGRGKRGEWVQIRFSKEAGQWMQRIPRAEWADRVRPAEFPGGDGLGHLRADDPDLVAVRRAAAGEESDEGSSAGGAGRGSRKRAKRQRKA